jgi:alkylation response protein AidB-like acyl-CoA dehydrogenase
MSYRAPVRDLIGALYGPAGFDRVAALDGALDRDTVTAILEAAGALASDVLDPLNAVGDRQGATLTPTGVKTPAGFAEAYKVFCAGGWNGLTADPAHGGQGLPRAVASCVSEIVQSANMAFGLCPMLTQGAIEALTAHGDDRQKSLFLPKLVSGKWTGAMALTEPQAGSDLAALTTRAEPAGEGLYRLHGQKIYITWGDHDCAENIVHLVLARLPGAPEGVRGISLFLAAKHRVGPDGALGEANGMKAVGLEHKLGIHGSPTCVIQYDGAEAELVGEAHKGLALMFTMMNAARLQVGVQGVAIAERAFQQALDFAVERRQGRSVLTGEKNAPLFDHPDIRRMLMLMKAKIRGGRALCLATATAADLATLVDNPAARERARLREELLTPIAKAWCTDMGVEATSLAIQIHGGMGYIEETGVAQYYRDARIAPIYEGANGVQAIDLAFRKLPLAGGLAIADLLKDIDTVVGDLREAEPDLQAIGARLEEALGAARRAVDWFAARGQTGDSLAGAYALMTLLGDLIAGAALAGEALADAGTNDSGRACQAVAQFFAETVLVAASGLAAAAMQGAGALAALTPDQLKA